MNERGLALVSVLWTISILSLIAASVMSAGNISYAIERNELKRVEGDSIAEAGVTLAVLRLLDPRPEKHWRVDGVPMEIVFAGIPVAVGVQDIAGLIDLNEADVSLLARLSQGAGLSLDDASRLAARIVDWRTSGDFKSANGANGNDYRAAHLGYAPRRAPFQSVDELKLVLGMTPELYARVAPALTVYSHQQNFDSRTAPREALLSLPGVDSSQADRILSERPVGSAIVNDQGPARAAGIADPTLLNGHAFAIRAGLEYRGIKITRRAIVRLTADKARPYLVLAWD